MLSSKARSRIYAPEGILDHHHAIQFITLSPPLDPHRRPIELNTERDEVNSSVTGSQGESVNSEKVMKDLKETLEVPPTRHSRLTPSDEREPINRGKRCCVAPLTCNVTGKSSTIETGSQEIQRERRRGLGALVQSLNCSKCRGQVRDDKINELSPSASLVTLTEEQERKWATFDISSPIAEDSQSLTGRSVVSMSAPLLSTTGNANGRQSGLQLEPLVTPTMAAF